MSNKKILIDGYNLVLDQGTGIATYARCLSNAVHELGHEVGVLYGTATWPSGDLLREIAFFSSPNPKSRYKRSIWKKLDLLSKSPRAIKADRVPITGKVISDGFASQLPYFDQLWNAPLLYDRARINFDAYARLTPVEIPGYSDIAHWTYLLPVRAVGAKNIYTIHDLVPLRLPYATTDDKGRFYSLAKRLADTADHIVTVSEHSRRDIIELLGIPEDRVTNTYQAVDIPERYTRKTDETVSREIEGLFDLPYKGYLLFFGAIEPKKNIGRLIEAYLTSGVKTPLIIVGKLGWQYESELHLIVRPSTEDIRYIFEKNSRSRIRLLGYVRRSLLISLIRGAKAVLFPSLYEGFGLPALEAMQLGAPVLASKGGSLPEVTGGAAMLVDPYDVDAMADAIRALDADVGLREELIKKGVTRAAIFSHYAYKERLMALYDRL